MIALQCKRMVETLVSIALFLDLVHNLSCSGQIKAFKRGALLLTDLAICLAKTREKRGHWYLNTCI